jgi:hypothetical protein
LVILSSILDIDLDYFVFLDNPVERLDSLLRWGARPVDFVVEHHHEALARWIVAVKQRLIRAPQFILHVDDHHDLLGERRPIGCGNFLYFAMRRWPRCRVHWLVQHALDSPDMWLSERAWDAVARRFSAGPHRRRDWPKPDLVSVCTSPDFVDEELRRRLLKRVAESAKSTRAAAGTRRTP